MGLTAHQQEKMQEIITLVKAGEKRIVIKGSAGTGKTFMTNELIRVLKTTLYQYGAVYVTAPTHKALSVLKKKITAKSYIHFKTIHSAHQLKRNINFKTGEATFVQIPENPKAPRFKAAQVVLCDEASMMEASIMKYNDDHPNLLFIFIGDYKQLPPVNEKESPVFTSGYPEVWLQEIVRQGKGSPIIELSNNLSILKLAHYRVNNIVEGLGGYVFENDRNYIIEKLAAVNGTDEIKYLAWTNADVNQMNIDVRKRIYGNPKRIEIGEGLVFAAPYRDYKNNQEIKVEDVEIVDYTLIIPTIETRFGVDESGNLQIANDKYELEIIKTYNIAIDIEAEEEDEEDEEEEETPKNYSIRVLHEDYDKLFHKYSLELKAKCKDGQIIWPAYYWFIEQFAQLNYNHAITVHKSQGSTYQTAIVNVGNIEMNRRKNPTETEKMLYTAVTRAAKLVVLYNVR